MKTDYEKQIAALQQEIERLEQEREEEKLAAKKAAFEAKPPEEKARIKWEEAQTRAVEWQNMHPWDYDEEDIVEKYRQPREKP
ncbi:MAG: hypothetical protein WCT49_05875 [Candidatus Paceibacterota bacterium]|jgi:hypothetical protein|nr:hypothetical protein [Candidatus Paceibacterota bacterium]